MGQSAAPEGTVCSELIWSATKRAGVQVEDTMVEPGDRPHPSDPAKLGLFSYSQAERIAGGEYLYQRVYNEFYEESGWLGRLLTDAPSDGANQIVNCFASDWCDTNAKDSERWRDPGSGIAVSPDDITHWDLPPAGVMASRRTWSMCRVDMS